MTSNDDEDPTVPGRQFPDDQQGAEGQGAEERTVPSQAGSAADGPAEESTVPAMDANAFSAGTGDLIGKTLGGCRIDRILGRGAMGAVYKARQLKLDRDVAVKIIRPEMMTDPRMLKRFEVEARTVGKFNSANVVMVHDVGFELGVHYLVMEFVQGKNLREHVKLLPNERLPAGDALPLIRQSCKGLEEARRLEVVHRDIKPDNLMLTDQGVLKIADFGIAKPVQDDFSMTLTSELIGTPLYMSPEQCQGGADIDFRSDMYSLGATFFYLLTGEPPIRASSVYELIQTKTKLENLCLWKSLPELDENHPLSRVIERMTANDREDRYESYEELLNDLVLVEAGETISARMKKPKKAGGGGPARRASDQAGGRGKLVAAAAVILLAGGGGYWWSQRGAGKDVGVGSGGGTGEVVDNSENGIGGTTPPVRPENDAAAIAAVEKALGGFAARLRKDGPAGLLANLKATKVPPALVKRFASLEQDVQLGERIEARLAKLKSPKKPQPPFEDVQSYLSSVDAECALPGTAGADLRQWVEARQSAKRGEAGLGDAAIAELRAALQDWRDRRDKVAGDDAALAELGGELRKIESGRDQLLGLFPGRLKDLNESVPRAKLDNARVSLRSGTGLPVVDRVPLGSRIEEMRTKYLVDGPESSLIESCRKLQPGSPEDLKLRNDLLDELNRAAGIQRTAVNSNQLYPTRPTAPEFRDVEAFFAAIDRPLAELQVDGSLPAWAEKLRVRLRREQELERSVERVCGDLWQDWQREERGGASAAKLTREEADIERAVARAIELFPQLSDKLAAAVPLAKLKAALADAKAKQQKRTWLNNLAAANRQLSGVLTLGAWQAADTELTNLGSTLKASMTLLGEDAQLAGQLRAFDAGCDKWRSAQAALAKASGQFGRGELTDCLRAINVASVASEGRAEFAELKAIVTSCREAFDVLERTLDIDQATAKLDQANRVLAASTSLPGAVAVQIKAWQDSFVKLKNAASGMVPIASAGRVGAFFLASTECSRRDFQAFQRKLGAAVQAGGADAVISGRLQGVPITTAQLQELVDWRSVGEDDRPIERVRWHEALAFCKWSGKDLPTADEWLLAAFGQNPKRKFSWGNDWSNSKQQRNPNGSKACSVADGGVSWRTTGAVPLHHMSGNVAEWLAGGDGGRADVAGGRYNQGMGQRAKDHASGKLENLSVIDRRSGIGFRAVLRPRDYSELSWPK